MSQFEVSVIIPVYQATQFVENAVVSALQFDCVKEVVIVLDENSPSLRDLAMQWSKIHNRVIILQHPRVVPTKEQGLPEISESGSHPVRTWHF
ncbi:MAG: glycosyltransferase [Saprospiraceae bacterium]|nr:glycosyltransferase [Saprospiraceae bacterium]